MGPLSHYNCVKVLLFTFCPISCSLYEGTTGVGYIFCMLCLSQIFTQINVELVEASLQIKGTEWAQQPPPQSVRRPTKMLREVH